jgi:hypothetical protein
MASPKCGVMSNSIIAVLPSRLNFLNYRIHLILHNIWIILNIGSTPSPGSEEVASPNSGVMSNLTVAVLPSRIYIFFFILLYRTGSINSRNFLSRSLIKLFTVFGIFFTGTCF